MRSFVKGVRILGTGSYLPERKVSNAEMARMVRNFDESQAGKPFDEWVVDVTGIHERHFAAEDETTEEMAAQAARNALEAASLDAKDVDLIVACSFTPSHVIPNMSCTLEKMLGAGQAGGVTINTACSGFLSGLAVAHGFIASGTCRHVLVVAAEKMSSVIDYDDPRTAVLFGDGAGAAVVGPCEEEGTRWSIEMVNHFSEHIHLVNNLTHPRMEGNETHAVRKEYLRMPGGPRVLRRAINLMAAVSERALEDIGWSVDDIDMVVPHQANGRIVAGLAEKMGVDAGRVMDTVKYHGNTSAASIPLALDAAVRGLPEGEGKRIKRGDKLLCTAVGGGYTIGAVAMEF